MSNIIECPYCEYDNDSTDASDSNTSWTCKKCEKVFTLEVDYEPTFTTSKDCSLNNEEHQYIEKHRGTLKDGASFIQYHCKNCDISKSEFIEPESKEKKTLLI